ncbi:MAG: hypothetical protein ACFNXZ_10170 [Lautropia mirabilis]
MPEASGTRAASDGAPPIPNLILTQDDASSAEWRALLEPAGLVSCHWPAFQIEALSDADILAAFEGGAEGVVLPSPAAVRVVAQALQRAGRRWPSAVWAGLPGAGSAHAFTRHFGTGPRLLVPPPPYQDAAHLARVVLCLQPLPQRIVVLNRPDGRREWAGVLQDAGVQVDWQPAYQARWCTAAPAGFMEAWQGWQAAVPEAEASGQSVAQDPDEVDEDTTLSPGPHWLIGSASVLRTVAGWLATLPPQLARLAVHRPVWLPHPRLIEVARNLGFDSPRVYHDRQQLIERLQSEEFRSKR